MEQLKHLRGRPSDIEKFSMLGKSSDYKLKAYLFSGNDSELESKTDFPFTHLYRLFQLYSIYKETNFPKSSSQK